jgi:hypothetical protein
MNIKTFSKVFSEEWKKYKTSLETESENLEKLQRNVTPPTFEEDPIDFILYSYPTLKDSLEEILSKNFLDYITGIYVIAPVPTTFKIILHNNQSFYMIYMGRSWVAKINGKKYYLLNVGERGRATVQIARLLAMGAPPNIEPSQDAVENQTAETTTDFGSDEVETETEETETLSESKKPLNEGKGEATLFETALVMAWYELNGQEMPEGAAESRDIESVDDKMLEKAKKVLQQTGLDKVEGPAKQLSRAPISEFWKSHGGSDNTTKADFVIGDKAISLKVGPSQLMSGGPGETLATFQSALDSIENSSEYKEIVNKLAETIKQTFVRGKTKTGTVAQAKKAGDDIELNKAVKMMNELTKEMTDFFEKNPDFRTAFAYEAASGSKKFDKGLGTANNILTISKDYSKGDLQQLSKEYSEKLGKKMKLDVNMKSNSEKIKKEKTGKYIYYSVLRSMLPDLFNVENVKADVETN